MLASIPSVVYGLWGIFILAPLLRTHVEPFLFEYLGFIPLFNGPFYGIGMLAAIIVLTIMILPTITSISREVFRTVPEHQKEAVLALGGTRWEMIKVAVLASSKKGLFGAMTLGLGRAIGETMAVTMVIGNRSEISLSLFDPSQTMASIIANEYTEATSEMHLAALTAVGLTLLVITLVVNMLARFIVWSSEKKWR
jgi:phosphate transport system permease protein